MSITTLIDKQDTYEIVRDQVAAILATETLAQQALATAALKDPDLWAFDVYTERKDPFSILGPDSTGEMSGDKSIINVWLERVDLPDGNDIKNQDGTAIINIDNIASKASKKNGSTIDGSDYLSSLDSERIARLARNIIMHPSYKHLGLTANYVKSRTITGIQKLFTDREDRPFSHVVVSRISLAVRITEFMDQLTSETLEQILIDVEKSDTGQVLVSLEIDTI